MTCGLGLHGGTEGNRNVGHDWIKADNLLGSCEH